MPSPTPHGFDRYFLRSLRLSILGSRGGAMRVRILQQLISLPQNVQMLSNALQIDYKTALYHVEKMLKEGWLVRDGEGYGTAYKVTFNSDQLAAFQSLVQELGQSLKPKSKESV